MSEVAHTSLSLPHSQHQVVQRRGGRGAVVLPSYDMHTTAIKAIGHSSHHSGEVPGCTAVGQGRAHGECTVAASSPERGGGQSIGDSTSRMQPEQCPCGDAHPPDRLRHIAVCCQGTQS